MEKKKYKTILADPPWKYGKGFGYGAGEYYPLMELKEIKKLPIKDISDENAHLYLWCPNSFVPQALDVMKSWGFEFKTVITWSELPLRKRSGFLIHSQLPKGLTSTPKAYQAVPALQENEE